MNPSSKLRLVYRDLLPDCDLLSYIFAILEIMLRRSLRESGIETESVRYWLIFL